MDRLPGNFTFFKDDQGKHILHIPAKTKIDACIDLQELLVELVKSEKVEKLVIQVQKYAYVKIYDTINSEMQIECIISDGAQLDFFTISADENQQVKKDLFFDLDTNARVNIHGAYMVSDKQKLHIHVAQKHRAQNAQSHLKLYGIVSGDASFDFKGSVFVAKEAARSVVSQENKTFIFGNAKIDAIPSMEVLNNIDVVCNHASAVGKIDDRQLLYLQSRGLTDADAKKILIRGFFDFLIYSFDNRRIKKDVEKRIKEKMRHIL